MKSHRLGVRSLTLAFAISFLAFLGCSNDPTGPGGPAGTNEFESGIDLNQAQGGVTTEDEAPAFGMRGETSFEEEGTEYDDDLLSVQPDVARLDDDPLARVTFLRILWGDLSRDSTHAADLTWDGGLDLGRGAIIVKRIIRFEREDHIVRPRTARDSLEWVSKTHGGVDGLLVKIVEPIADLTPVVNTLTFFSPNLNVTFDTSVLADIDSVFTVDNTGNAVSFSAVRPPRNGPRCLHGFAGGVWMQIPDDDHRGGVFRGMWVGAEGRLMGHLDGRWGINDEGQQVWAGKFIDESGRFEGILHGKWSLTTEGRGEFHGRWLDGDHGLFGQIHGHFHLGDSAAGGGFHAVWKMHCRPGGPPGDDHGDDRGDGGDHDGDGDDDQDDGDDD